MYNLTLVAAVLAANVLLVCLVVLQLLLYKRFSKSLIPTQLEEMQGSKDPSAEERLQRDVEFDERIERLQAEVYYAYPEASRTTPAELLHPDVYNLHHGEVNPNTHRRPQELEYAE